MTHFQDLTPYRYGDQFGVDDFEPEELDSAEAVVLNVGWLARGQEYPTRSAAITDHLEGQLRDLCRRPVRLTKGVHHCEFCAWTSSTDTGGAAVGNGEIRVPGTGAVVYAAPQLVGHYVREHQYAPPTEFVDAVLAYQHD